MRRIVAAIVFVSAAASVSVSAAPADRLEQLLDVFVTANFNDDFPGAAQALTAVVEFERASGTEPSGRLAVIQLRETQAFADRLASRIQGYIDGGFPVLAAMELQKFSGILRFEPSGASRYRAMAATVDEAGAVLCNGLQVEVATHPGIRNIADGVCAGFGRKATEGPSSAGGPAHSTVLVPAAVGGFSVNADVKGFVDPAVLSGAVNATLGSSVLVGQGGLLALSVSVSGTSVLSEKSEPGRKAFEYAVEVPYAEMEEYCEWVEESKLETVVEGNVSRTVKRTVRTCNKSQRPVDKVRIEPRTMMIDGVSHKRTVIWQYRVSFDDGAGCSGKNTFDGRDVYDDFEHGLSNPAIGLAPAAVGPADPAVVAVDMAGRISGWIAATEGDCLRRAWCTGESNDLESTLRCASLPGSDPHAVDTAIGARFGVSATELLRFTGGTR